MGGGKLNIDNIHTAYIVCPNCGNENIDVWEFDATNNNKVCCSLCGEEFNYGNITTVDMDEESGKEYTHSFRRLDCTESEYMEFNLMYKGGLCPFCGGYYTRKDGVLRRHIKNCADFNEVVERRRGKQ